jgi:hypothetical protein
MIPAHPTVDPDPDEMINHLEDAPCVNLLDEADSVNWVRSTRLRRLFNGGYDEGRTVPSRRRKGEKVLIFAPFVLATIRGVLPAPMLRRCLPLNQQKAVDDSVLTRLATRLDEIDLIRQQLIHFLQGREADLNLDPPMPKELRNNEISWRDNFRPLFAIADLIDKVNEEADEKAARTGRMVPQRVKWGDRAREVAKRISVRLSPLELKVLTLSSLKTIFDGGFKQGTTAELVQKLNAIHAGVWKERIPGGFTPAKLAEMLDGFNKVDRSPLGPGTIRKGERTFRGYKAEWFADALKRYVIDDPAATIYEPDEDAPKKPKIRLVKEEDDVA